METKPKQISSILIPIVLLASLLIALFAFSSRNRTPLTVTGAPGSRSASQVTDASKEKPNRFPYGVPNLKGASSEEVGSYAQEYAKVTGLVRSGTPTVLLSIPITREKYTALGLGCLPDFGTIEEPPLTLVILKGDLQFSRASILPNDSESLLAPGGYAAYVFDMWAARPVALDGTLTGGSFRKALNDPTLPTNENWNPGVCPTPLPASKKTMHYGDVAPGLTAPPPLPEDVTSRLAPATTSTPASAPPPIATETVR
ncbi:MAG: hypothetical protein QOH93_2014 [Chloroflexia bacterium]|jgi:hypothetical protein|nr:hypothetical protein [Chloroflexia bacterium]